MKAQSEPWSGAIGPPLYVCPLLEAEELRSVGAKAHTLGRMIKLGVPVPPGFVVCNEAFQQFLRHNDLVTPIAEISQALDIHSAQRLQNAAEIIRGLIRNAKVPRRIREEIILLRDEMLCGSPLIVRSSAVGEDSAEASFAGQLDSCPNVNSIEDLEQALLACWASYWSERSLFYQLSRRIQLNGMAIIIQHMVQARISGVLFTRSPAELSGDKADQFLVEYCFGQGEALVSGKINPGRFVISRSDFHWRLESSPEQPPDRYAEEALFDRARIFNLTSIGTKLEHAFGSPQDIEWVMDDQGCLSFVQSRPITTRPTATKQTPQPLANRTGLPGEKLVLWSNANVNENFPAPISPLLYSIAATGYYYYFRNLACAFGLSRRRLRAMEHQLRNIIGVHCGRMYYNLTNIHSALRAAPFGERLVDDFNHFVGVKETAQRSRPKPSGQSSRYRWLLDLLAVSVIFLKTLQQYLFLSKRVETFERTVSEFSECTPPEQLKERSLQELLGSFRTLLEIRFDRWTNAALADAASMVCYGALTRFINREFPGKDEASLHHTLLKGLCDLVSSKPALKLWELSRGIQQNVALRALFDTKDSREILTSLETKEEFTDFRRELGAFLDDWGFRYSGELMLTVPSFQENPSALLDILKGYLRIEDKSPGELIQQQDAERASETTRILAILSKQRLCPFFPFITKAHLAKLLLRWTHRSISLRERARLKQALLYSRCRRIVLAIGEQLAALGYLADRDDVFFLTHQELDQLICGSAMFPYHTKELVPLRKKEHAEFSAMCPPDTIQLAEGAYLPMQQDSQAQPRDLRPGEKTVQLTGTSAGGGKTTARASILKDISEAGRLNPGDVLVARQTDPGWGPVFFLIRGLVLERGGVLSHGAIIAREFGIPSVVGVKNATWRIPQGRTVSVDGDHGLVTVID